MKSIWKYIVGFFSFIGGILTLFLLGSKKNKKVKELDGAIKDVNKEIKNAKDKGSVLNKTLESKKKALKEIKKEQYKKEDVGAKEASDFLKKFSKGKK